MARHIVTISKSDVISRQIPQGTVCTEC